MQRKRTSNSMQVIVDSTISCNGQTDKIHTEAQGRFYEKNGIWYLLYKEPSESGLAGVTTTIKAQPGCVVILRSEPYASRMVIEQGKTCITAYPTEGGLFELEVRGERVAVLLRENGGEIRLQYSLFLASGDMLQTVSMVIQVKDSV